MASLWAQERAERAIDRWSDDPGMKLKDLIAEALDQAEIYGFNRGFKNCEDLARNLATTE